MVVKLDILLIIFIFFMTYLTFLAYKKKQFGDKGLVLWMLLWVGSIILVAFHNFFNQFISQLNIIRVFDLYTIIALMILFFSLFFIFKAIIDLTKKVERLTRHIAVKEK